MANQSFQHITPALRIFAGPDCLGQLDRELERVNSRRAVIFCGSSLARSQVLGVLQAAMGQRCAGVFAGVRTHSPVPAVEAAAQELRRLSADAVIAVGGGSAVVTARAASILLAEPGDVKSLSTSVDASGKISSPKLLAPKLPQLVIPTTPTTATVKVGSAVYDPALGKRFALFDPKTRAQAIFVHPDFIKTTPLGLVTGASLDTLSLAIEGLTSNSGEPLSDALLMHSLRLLKQNLANPALDDDLESRRDLVLAAILCGQGTDYTGAGIATTLGHAIGARHDVDNGTVKAVVLPHVMRFNSDAARSGLVKVAASLGLTDAAQKDPVEAVIKAIEGLLASIRTPTRLRDLAIPRDALPEIATIAMGDWFLRGNPRPVRAAAELEEILLSAW